MRILLVRHGIASARDPERPEQDHKRRLTDKGRRRMEDIGSGLARLLPRPDAIFTSPLVRALGTADLLSAAWNGKPGPQVIDALAPGHATLTAVSWLRSEARREFVVVVGHEPALSRLLARLVAGRGSVSAEFKKGGVALVEASPAGTMLRGKLLWFAPPLLLVSHRR